MVSRNLGFRFTLVSYNILSQTLLNDHHYLYSNCNPKDLEWPKRGHRIVSELLENQADIICLQEVESEHLQSLYRPKLARYGYECLYKKKTGYKIDGCAIFYKRKLFHLLNFKGIEFNRSDVTNLLNRDNVGIIAVFKPKYNNQLIRNNNNNAESNQQQQQQHENVNNNNNNSRQLVIANTHLIFNPKRSDIKLAQLKLFLSELEEISFEHYDSVKNERHHHPTILCGDLNSVPGSEVNHFILNKQFQLSPSETMTTISAPTGPSSDLGSMATTATTTPTFNENNETTQITTKQTISHKKEADNHKNDDNEVDETAAAKEISSIRYLSKSKHSFKFESVYPTQNRHSQPYVSTFSSCIVDYIFYTKSNLRLESYRELLTEDELKNVGPIPNSEFPSDHLTLEAKFSLR